MIASIVSLVVLAMGLSIYTRAAYMLGRDGLEKAGTSRRRLSYLSSGLLVVMIALFLNKSLE
jgi:hypothetical protein